MSEEIEGTYHLSGITASISCPECYETLCLGMVRRPYLFCGNKECVIYGVCYKVPFFMLEPFISQEFPEELARETLTKKDENA